MSRLTRADQAAAERRVAADGKVPLDGLRHATGNRLSARTLQRWIVEGKGGIHLDGSNDPKLGWCSSLAAVRRFLDAVHVAETLERSRALCRRSGELVEEARAVRGEVRQADTGVRQGLAG